MNTTFRKCLARIYRSPAGGSQRGVALITALMVVALTAVVAVATANRQELDVRRTANLLQADQAYAYALGVETWAQVILERDKKDSEVDFLGEDWASIIPPIAVDGGQVAGRIEDLQGRFNLNNLFKDGTESADHVNQFKRLLKALDLDEDLVSALLDWMDENIDTRFPEGGEDDYYLALKTPYRTANRPLTSISELRLIKGFDAAAVASLLPHVTVLENGTKINVNTATDMVLRSLADDIPQSDAETLMEARSEEGFETMAVFLQHNVLAGRKVNAGLLSLESENFLVHAEVNVGTARTHLYSVIQRDKETSTVAFRSRSSE